MKRFLSLNCLLESVSGARIFNVKRNLRSKEKMGCSTSKVEVSRSTDPEQEDDFVEGVVCKASEIKDNEMKTFDLGDAGRVLVVRQHGKLTALGAKCTHLGAPLSGAALGDGRIRCQWHGACFSILNGDIEDFPGLDSLPCYQVSVTNDEVTVRAKRSQLESGKRVKAMTKRDPSEAQHIVVVGGGPSGATCVEALRQEGFAGRITLVCRENCLPYDRVLVSKTMNFDISRAEFRTQQFYTENGIEVVKGVEATSVDAKHQTVRLSNGSVLNFDRLYLAVGQRANKIQIPGSDLGNVMTLRDYEDARATDALLGEGVEVVVLGSSFVAMEAADYCLSKAKKVTVVARNNYPFEPLLGERVGAAFRKLFEEKGVVFLANSGLERCIDGGQGKVGRVELKGGAEIRADVVIMGVGSRCNTEFLQGSGLELRPDGSIEVDEFLQTSVENVFVGGDIAYAPVWSYGNRKATIGHYSLAHYHGKVAALNMIGKRKRLEAVPYFWTKLFGKSIRYAGHGKYDSIIHIGDVEGYKFVAFYLDGDEVVAAASTGMDPVVSQFAEILAHGHKLYRKDVEGDGEFLWTKKLHDG